MRSQKKWKGIGHRYFGKSVTSHPLRQKLLRMNINIGAYRENTGELKDLMPDVLSFP